MKKIILIVFGLALYSFGFAQDMPGMKMPAAKKETKKPVATNKGSKPAQKVSYTCVMHPEIHSSKPGNCPKCGMKLVKEKPKASTAKKQDEMQIPADTSMPQKMDMGAKDNMQMPSNKNTQAQPTIYTCVMHPEIHSSKPGNCPKCGMKLVKEKPKANANNKAKDDMKMDDMKGMDMSKKENVNPSQPATYTCVMHPEIHSTKPGNCPRCGMKLVKEKPKASTAKKQDEMQMPADTSMPQKMDNMQMPSNKNTQAQPTTYTCVMHPEIHSSKPGNCPKCGMKLVKEKPKASTAKKQDEMQMPADTSMPQKMDMGAKDNMQMPSNKNTQAQPTTYTCVMHPEIHSTKPGNCPKCGMKLVKEKPKANADNKAKDDMKMDDMKGMDMSKKESANPSQPTSYTCVMHPEIHSNKPGNCPKCGMKLVKEKPKAATSKKDEMQMPAKDGNKQMDGMAGMQMNDNNETMDNIKMAKKNLGPMKTITSQIPPHTVRYDLYIRDTTVTFGKKPTRAIAVNGQIPMPTLTFTEGDTAEIWVHNELKEETSLHWHGLFLPNKMDGVPFLTQMPIKPGATYLYKFPIIQHGTHWYHSHSGLQEQIGMYGAFIMNKRKEWDIPTVPVVLSDWIDMSPKEVNRSLHNQTDWFGIRKNSIQSYSEAIKTGHLKTKLTNEWKRMLAMDVSDVAYDKFLINGKQESSYIPPSGGRGAVRLRIANGGASSYFWLKYAGGKITVVATDGNDVEPVEVDRLLIAVSETYDVVVTIPDNKSYEFLVTPEDRTKSASLWLGSGPKVPAERLPTLKYFAGMKMMNDMMDMHGNMVPMEGMQMANQTMDMNTVMYPEITGASPNPSKGGKMAPSPSERAGGEVPDIVTLNYAMLKAPEKTTLRPGPLKTLSFELTGNMNRYVWSIDNKVVSEADKILIKRGENVRIILYNNTMMRHPMHLHGHDFRLLNGQGEYAVMKNIIDIMPMERDTIEFAATEQGGDWFFHCHILYHMMSGMGRVFSYQDTLIDKTDITSAKVAKRGLNSDDRHYHSMARIGLESAGSDGMAMLSNTRNTISTLWHLGIRPEHGEESETTIGRYLGRMQWWRPFIGYDYHYKKVGPNGEEIMKGIMGRNIFGSDTYNMFGQLSNKNNRSTMTAGIQYLLPMNVLSEFRADLYGKLRIQLMREDIPLTPRLRGNFMVNTDKEYAAGFRYIITKYFNLSTHYDSDMGLGAGITITY